MLERLSAVVASKVNRSSSTSAVAAYELTLALNWGTSLRPSTTSDFKAGLSESLGSQSGLVSAGYQVWVRHWMRPWLVRPQGRATLGL